jgi:hypothetical protein
MNDFVLIIGVLAIAVGLVSSYARAHDKVNALGKYTGPANAFVVLGGILLIILAFAQ